MADPKAPDVNEALRPLLDALGDLAKKVTPVAIALVLVGFVFHSRLGKYLARFLLSGTKLTGAGIEAAWESLAGTWPALRFVVRTLFAATIVGAICGIIGWYQFGFWVTFLGTLLPLAALLLVRGAVHETIGKVEFLGVGKTLEGATVIICYALAIMPIMVSVWLLYRWLAPLLLPSEMVPWILGLAALLGYAYFLKQLLVLPSSDPRSRGRSRSFIAAVTLIVLTMGTGLAVASHSAALKGTFGGPLKKRAQQISQYFNKENREGVRLGSLQLTQNYVWTGQLLKPLTTGIIISGEGVRWWDCPGDTALINGGKIRVFLNARHAADCGYAGTVLADSSIWVMASALCQFNRVYGVMLLDPIAWMRTTEELGWEQPIIWVPAVYIDEVADESPKVGVPVARSTGVPGSYTDAVRMWTFGRDVWEVPSTDGKVTTEVFRDGDVNDTTYTVRYKPKHGVLKLEGILLNPGDRVEWDFDPDITIKAFGPVSTPGEPDRFTYCGPVTPLGFPYDPTMEKGWRGEFSNDIAEHHKVADQFPYFCALWRTSNERSWRIASEEPRLVDEEGYLQITFNGINWWGRDGLSSKYKITKFANSPPQIPDTDAQHFRDEMDANHQGEWLLTLWITRSKILAAKND